MTLALAVQRRRHRRSERATKVAKKDWLGAPPPPDLGTGIGCGLPEELLLEEEEDELEELDDELLEEEELELPLEEELEEDELPDVMYS